MIVLTTFFLFIFISENSIWYNAAFNMGYENTHINVIILIFFLNKTDFLFLFYITNTKSVLFVVCLLNWYISYATYKIFEYTDDALIATHELNETFNLWTNVIIRFVCYRINDAKLST